MDLDTWLQRQPYGRTAELAREIGVSRNTVDRIRARVHVPRLLLAIAIEDATGGAVTVRDLAGLAKRRKR